MDGATERVLGDLLATTKAIGYEDRLRSGGTDGGEQYALGKRLRHVVSLTFEAKWPCHAATSAVKQGGVRACLTQKVHFRIHAAHALLMAVTMHDNAPPRQVGQMQVSLMLQKKLAEQGGLAGETAGTLIVWKKVEKLIVKDAGAAWLQHDDGHASVNLTGEAAKNAGKVRAGLIQKAKVVERAATANMLAGNLHAKPGGLDHLSRGMQR